MMEQFLAVSVGLGLAVSLLFSEMFGLAAGGMVVPGYIALYLTRPLDVVLTLGAGILTYAIVHALSLSIVIYGKRRTVVMILIGYALGMSVGTLSTGMFYAGSIPLVGAEDASSKSFGGIEFSVIGYIIPGLIGIWIDRQGLIETLSVLLTAAVVVRLLLILLYGTELHV